MKKIFKLLVRGFCALSGLIMAPVLIALLLAGSMGLLPTWERLRTALASTNPEATLESSDESESADVAAEAETPPSELGLWRLRLESIQDSLRRGQEQLDSDRKELEQLRRKLDLVQSTASEVTSALLGRSISPGEILEKRAEIIAEIEQLQEQEKRFPELLAAMKTVEPASFAKILASGEPGEAGFNEANAVRILRGLPSRKTSQIFDELSKEDPVLAGRLIERMSEQSRAADRSREVAAQDSEGE